MPDYQTLDCSSEYTYTHQGVSKEETRQTEKAAREAALAQFANGAEDTERTEATRDAAERWRCSDPCARTMVLDEPKFVQVSSSSGSDANGNTVWTVKVQIQTKVTIRCKQRAVVLASAASTAPDPTVLAAVALRSVDIGELTALHPWRVELANRRIRTVGELLDS